MVPTITRDEVQRRLADGNVTLVEALPASNYEDAHLPGAINLPHDEVDTLAPALLPDKQAEIVVYCANQACANSGIAVTRLMELGYTNVRGYEAGKQDWIDAGLATESSTQEAQGEVDRTRQAPPAIAGG
jgi:rhodanese-related sulfurtransferase